MWFNEWASCHRVIQSSTITSARSEIRTQQLQIPMMEGTAFSFIANFDTHFIGLTPLNEISTDACFEYVSILLISLVCNIQLPPIYTKRSSSLVFVTGLAGHAYGSWKVSGGTTMWIQDFLVPDLQEYNFRILTYGYDSRLPGSTSNAGISEFAHGFLQSFFSARQSNNVRSSL